MKENELRRILTKPTIDMDMDRRVEDTLLNCETDIYRKDNIDRYSHKKYPLYNKGLSSRFSKVAVIGLLLIIIGTGTVFAANYFVRSYNHKIKFITEDEYEPGTPLYGEDTIRTYFGGGNKLIALPRDDEGNLYQINDEGLIIMGEEEIRQPLYLPDPERHEKARKSGDEAFAEIGYPNLIPSYIYDNYLLNEKGHICYENNRDGVTQKWLRTEFIMDGYESDDFFSETIWIEFFPYDVSVDKVTSVYTEEVGTEEDFIFSTYTTKGGILCSIQENVARGNNITAHILFDSDGIGNGSLMIDFHGTDMDKVKEILDTFPLTEDMIN